MESAAARICREAGGRVATNRFVRDLYIGVPVNDGRRMKSCCGRTPCARWGPARRDTTLVVSVAL